MYLCGESIRSVLINWIENPVSMSFTEKPASISEIPFPTITVCPEVKAHKEKMTVDDDVRSIPELFMRMGTLSDEG